jgi:hypothetical protein
VYPVDQFALHARGFRDWVDGGTDKGAAAARSALKHVTRLYLSALSLPSPYSSETDRDAERVGRTELQRVYQAMSCLPLHYYSKVFDPLPVSAQSPVVGDLADDLADIYGEVMAGLRAYEAGDRANAIWEWGFGFIHHGGEHATSAIRALHCWLATNEPGGLSNPD